MSEKFKKFTWVNLNIFLKKSLIFVHETFAPWYLSPIPYILHIQHTLIIHYTFYCASGSRWKHIALDYATAADFHFDSSLADAFFISLFSLSLTSLYYLPLFFLAFLILIKNLVFLQKKKTFFYYARSSINKSIW